MVIRENEYFKRVRTVLQAALDSLGISGPVILQTQQPTPTSAHCVVLVHRLYDKRYGWQGSSFDKRPLDNIDQMTEVVDYLNEATFQISAYCPRRESDGVSRLTAGDVISAIHMWLHSDFGIAKMNDNGLQMFRSTEIRNPEVVDDSQTPQFNPNFDIRLVTYNSADFRIGAINDVEAVEKSIPGGGPLINAPLKNIIQGHYTESAKM